ncbi:MAG: epoxyqueuosine reductase QueH [Candidatus Delongbacteria bacterium]|jgi:predicted adenine nucleotide alpha hydrolase (AANH) superfamily ATPase|nr:epoxyqueuosine reductase QueH [Candidatus Delongbacteria bacterium]
MKNNYNKLMEERIDSLVKSGHKPKLLIHVCCAPCSTYVLELLEQHFILGLYYYNPNIYPEEEHERRFVELQNFLRDAGYSDRVELFYEEYSPLEFAGCAYGLEDESEGGLRCFSCYELRLSKTAQKAKEAGFEYFTTTLTVSPHKNADRINTTGERLASIYEVKFLNSDFKKKNGFKRTVELSRKYDLYRQDYCGCEFSMKSELKE